MKNEIESQLVSLREELNTNVDKKGLKNKF